jgi:hypothetical protein
MIPPRSDAKIYSTRRELRRAIKDAVKTHGEAEAARIILENGTAGDQGEGADGQTRPRDRGRPVDPRLGRPHSQQSGE